LRRRSGAARRDALHGASGEAKRRLKLQTDTTTTVAADKRIDFRKAVDLIETSAVRACGLG